MADWNKRYGADGPRLFGDAPNEYVREVCARSDFTARSALCLGDGDGRNGSWLAAQGLRVSALDLSDVATAQAVAHDRMLGVEVERHTADLVSWAPPAVQRWDAVFMIFLQCEAAVRQRAAALAAAALEPGGWFIAEGFAADRGSNGENRADGRLGPGKADLLYDMSALIDAMPGFRLVEAFEGVTWLEEGARHRGPAHVVRLAARRIGDGD